MKEYLLVSSSTETQMANGHGLLTAQNYDVVVSQPDPAKGLLQCVVAQVLLDWVQEGTDLSGETGVELLATFKPEIGN